MHIECVRMHTHTHTDLDKVEKHSAPIKVADAKAR